MNTITIDGVEYVPKSEVVAETPKEVKKNNITVKNRWTGAVIFDEVCSMTICKTDTKRGYKIISLTNMTKTPEDDEISRAEKNYIEVPDSNDPKSSSMPEVKGTYGRRLYSSSDFHLVDCPFSVWEVTEDTKDWLTFASDFVCIHRASKSTLEEALKYMTAENRVLVHNKIYKEPID